MLSCSKKDEGGGGRVFVYSQWSPYTLMAPEEDTINTHTVRLAESADASNRKSQSLPLTVPHSRLLHSFHPNDRSKKRGRAMGSRAKGSSS